MHVFYRFKSESEYNKIEIARSSIPLWELRAEVISLRHLSMHDYHLVFYLDKEGSPLTDNYTAVHANARVVIERVPNYMQMGYKEALEKTKPTPLGAESVEENPHRISMVNTFGAKAPPPFYICFRCGEKGHYIQMCPTNSNRQYDGVRVRKATGIPKIFLVPAEESSSAVMMNEDGKFVRAQAQTKEFSKHFSGRRGAREAPPSLICAQCKTLFVDPVLLECGHSVCECCFSPRCPACGKKSGRAAPDAQKRRQIEGYLENDRV